MKKIFFPLTLFIVICFFPSLSLGQSTPRLFINNIEVQNTPIISTDMTKSFISLRALAMTLGSTVQWLPETQEIVITKRTHTFKAPLSDKTLFKQVDDTTYIATQAIPKVFDCTLELKENVIAITASFTYQQLTAEAFRLLTAYITDHNIRYPTTPILNDHYSADVAPSLENPLLYDVTASYIIEDQTITEPFGKYEQIIASSQLIYENQTFHIASLTTIDHYHFNPEASLLTPEQLKTFDTVQYAKDWLNHTGFNYSDLPKLLYPSTSFLSDAHLVKHNAYIKGSNGVSYAKYMNQPFYKQLSTSSAFNTFIGIPFRFEPEFYPVYGEKNNDKLSVTFVVLTSVLPPHPIVTMNINYVITPQGLQPTSIENITSYNDMLAFKQLAPSLFKLYAYKCFYPLY